MRSRVVLPGVSRLALRRRPSIRSTARSGASSKPRIDELPSGLRNHEDWYRTDTKASSRGAPNEQAPENVLTVGADDEYVGRDFRCRIAECVRGIIRRDHLMNLCARRVLAHKIRELLSCLDFALVAQDLAPGAFLVGFTLTTGRDDDVGEVKLSAHTRRSPPCPRHRRERRIGEVDAHKPPGSLETLGNRIVTRSNQKLDGWLRGAPVPRSNR